MCSCKILFGFPNGSPHTTGTCSRLMTPQAKIRIDAFLIKYRDEIFVYERIYGKIIYAQLVYYLVYTYLHAMQ